MKRGRIKELEWIKNNLLKELNEVDLKLKEEKWDKKPLYWRINNMKTKKELTQRDFNFNDNLGIKQKSYAVMACLKDILSDMWYESEKEIFINSFAIYNGRENSIGITLRKAPDANMKVIVFGENINSDHIFVDVWDQKYYGEIPTIKNMSEETYSKRKFFSYNKTYEVAEYIYKTYIKILEESEEE